MAIAYGCTINHNRGASVCPNRTAVPMNRVDDAILQTLGGDVLRQEVVEAVVDGGFARVGAPETSVKGTIAA